MYVANVGIRERMERAPVSDGTTLLPSLSSTSTYVHMARREKREEARTSLSSLLLIAVTLSPKNTYERAGRGRSLCSLVEPATSLIIFGKGWIAPPPPKKRNLTPHNFREGVNCATHKKKTLEKKKQSGGKGTWNCMLLISMLLLDNCIFPNPEFKFAFFQRIPNF